MFKFCSLFSGSSGNCSFIQTDTTKILVDIGESTKKIVTALEGIHVLPEEIDGILITHEHSDHIKGLATFTKKFHTPVFTNIETWNAITSQIEKLSSSDFRAFTVPEKFCIKDLEIEPFSIPHDAANPCGFNIYHENKKISIATDIGHMNNDIILNLTNSSFIMLEANYDPDILKCSSYPYMLKQRIAGPNGHLSNDMAGKTISYLSNYGLKSVMLGHLSKENNFPELAYETVANTLIENNINMDTISLSVANRFHTSSIIDVS